MTRRQRRVLQAVGVLVALAALAAGVAAISGSNSMVAVRVRNGGAAADEPSTPTTMALPTVTASTRPPEPSSTTTSPTTQPPPPTTAPPGEEVTGEGAILVRPDLSPPRPLVGDCTSLADEGWSTVDCDRVQAKGADLVWLVEERGDALRALVLRPSTAGAWAVILASDEDGSRWREISIRTPDVSGDGAPEIAVGFRQRGGSDVLALDLVEGPGRVVVHDNLNRGVARLRVLELETWEASAPESDTFVHAVIRFDAGAYRRATSEEVPASSVPKSDL